MAVAIPGYCWAAEHKYSWVPSLQKRNSHAEHSLLAAKRLHSYTGYMSIKSEDIKKVIRTAIYRMVDWVRAPYTRLYVVAFVALAWGGFCFALPAWVGLALFVPFVVVIAEKTRHAVRRILSLDLIDVEEQEGRLVLDTQADRMQRSWALGSSVCAVGVLVPLLARAGLEIFPGLAISDSLATYLTFLAVLFGGFLAFYVLALRFDTTWLRGLTSLIVTLPTFFIVVALASILLSWAMRLLSAIGVSAESLLKGGFSWLYSMQDILGTATDYFLRQDAAIVTISIIVAALLLLLYAGSVPYYWIRSVRRWLRSIGIVAAAFGAGVLVFAGVWLSDMQNFMMEGASDHLASALGNGVDAAEAISRYSSDDLIALIKAFVLPYTVGVFVATAVVGWRNSHALAIANGILDGFSACQCVSVDDLPAQQKRYLYYGGSQTLWDIALRSIGRDIPLPHPFAPRKLSLEERITGVLQDPPPPTNQKVDTGTKQTCTDD